MFLCNTTIFDKYSALVIPLPEVRTRGYMAPECGFQFGYFPIYYHICVNCPLIILLLLRQEVGRAPSAREDADIGNFPV
jgi:hypothetical protein